METFVLLVDSALIAANSVMVVLLVRADRKQRAICDLYDRSRGYELKAVYERLDELEGETHKHVQRPARPEPKPALKREATFTRKRPRWTDAKARPDAH